MNPGKEKFLREDFIKLLRMKTESNPPSRWGRMGFQQMLEHVADFFRVSTGKINMPLVTPEEHLPKYREFMMSEKEFRENTKAPMLPEEPFPEKYSSISEALEALEQEVNGFFTYFHENQETRTIHPVFGSLNYEEWVQLHHKHVTHHLKQFSVI